MKIPRFVKTLYFLLEKESPSSVATWATDSLSFVIVCPHVFASTLLPKYFGHSNWTKFTAELARFGFRPDRATSKDMAVEYSHVDFQRGNLKRLHCVQPRRQGELDRRAVVDEIEDTILQIKRKVVQEVVAAQDIANCLESVVDDLFDVPPLFRPALPPPSTPATYLTTGPMYLPAAQLPWRRIPA
ncbi:hypothetical protein DYB32_004702 [Aphanomyces invadans]|uniref:HSF-type DNA-binding domain-containing protein n=1 Tax=Aphanomyces invadans TaxID=157072 RepID=A0A418AWV8_9STRA|nr:hypothetical protein DYB32_004702 [Aphanomyces invadans]